MLFKVYHLPLLLHPNTLCQDWHLCLEHLEIQLHLPRICLDILDLNDEDEKKLSKLNFTMSQLP